MTNPIDRAVAAGTPRAGSALLLTVLCLAHFMDAIDVSDVNVALPAIQQHFALSPGGLSWVVSAYLLGYGGFLLLGGRSADVLGPRRILLIAVGVFAVVSLIAALAPNAAILIAARAVKGIAAGFLAPAALSLITTIWTDPAERGRAIGAFATAGAAGFVGGLLLGGLVTEISWRYAFALPVPFALIVLALAPRLVPRSVDHVTREPLDVPGAILATLGCSFFVVYLTLGPDLGWTHPGSLASILVAVAALAGFGLRESRTRAPLLPLPFLRQRSTVATSLAIATIWAAYTGFAFLATLGMQDRLGWSPLQTGLAFVPIGIVNGVLAPMMGRLAGRIGAGPLVTTGIVLLTISYALYYRMGDDAGYVDVLLPIMVANGLGIACTFAPLNLAAMSGAQPGRQGLAASVFNTAMQIGGAVGLAIVTVVVAATGNTSHAPTTALVITSAMGLIGAVLLRTSRSR